MRCSFRNKLTRALAHTYISRSRSHKYVALTFTLESRSLTLTKVSARLLSLDTYGQGPLLYACSRRHTGYKVTKGFLGNFRSILRRVLMRRVLDVSRHGLAWSQHFKISQRLSAGTLCGFTRPITFLLHCNIRYNELYVYEGRYLLHWLAIPNHFTTFEVRNFLRPTHSAASCTVLPLEYFALDDLTVYPIMCNTFCMMSKYIWSGRM